MKKTIVLCILGLGLWTASAQAQIKRTTDRITRQAQNRVERNIENNVNRKVDRAVDDAFNGNTRKKSRKQRKREAKQAAQQNNQQQSNNDNNGSPSSGGVIQPNNGQGSAALPQRSNSSTASYNSPNQKAGGQEAELKISPFVGSFTLEVENKDTEKNRSEITRLNYQIREFDIAVAISDAKGKVSQRLVFQRKERKTIVMDDERKIATITPMSSGSWGRKQRNDNPVIKVNRTGETKKIGEFTCVRYLVETLDEEVEVWSDEDSYTQTWAAAALANLSQAQGLQDWRHPEIKGCPREAIATSKDEPHLKTRVSLINVVQAAPPAKAFTAEGYQVTDLTD